MRARSQGRGAPIQNAVRRAGDRFGRGAKLLMPEPFVLALLLTGVAFAAALALTPAAPGALVVAWATGLWGFLAFAMQMALVLVTGHAIASAPPVMRAVHCLAALPRTGAGAAALTALVAGAAGLVNWGLGLILGAYLAREMGRQGEARGLDVHYPLLGAAGYLGMLVWHGGLSGSAPLVMATARREILPELGVVPISQTLFSPMNLAITLCVLLVATGLVWMLAPRDGRVVPFSQVVPGALGGPAPAAGRPVPGAGVLALALAFAVTFILVRANLASPRGLSFSGGVMAALNLLVIALVARQVLSRVLGRRPRLGAQGAALAGLTGAAGAALVLRSPLGPGWALAGAALTAGLVPALLLGAARRLGRRAGGETPAAELDQGGSLPLAFGGAGLAYLEFLFATRGFELDLNLVILAFLSVGLLLRESPAAYVEAVADAVPGTAGIVLQFPFYAGLLAIMQASGLLAVIAGGMVAVASAQTFPLLAFLSAGLVNVFVPSGGGQWAVQGPIVVEAARGLGVPLEQAILAVSYGDEWTNMLQPFWALPLLGITGLRARDVVGYTIIIMLVTGLVFAAGLLLFALAAS